MRLDFALYLLIAASANLWVDSLAAQEPTQTSREALARKAEQWMTAGEYRQALDLYQSLLDQSKEPWERAILHYNLGSAYLEQGNWTQALREFDAIDLSKDPAPRLARRVHVNRALALTGLVNQKQQTELPQSTFPLETLDESLDLLTNALTDLEASEAADCQLAQLEGSRDCDVALDLQETRRTIENLMLQLRQQSDAIKAKELAPIDLIGTLQVSLKRDAKTLSSLSTDAIFPYMDLQEQQRTPLWQALQKLPQLFAPLATDYEQLQTARQNHQDKALSQAIDHLVSTIPTLIPLLYPENMPAQQLATLSLAYDDALGAAIDTETLEGLSKLTKQAETGIPGSVQEQLMRSEKMLQASLSELNLRHDAQARILLTMASVWAKRALETSLPSENAPEKLLSNAIYTQQLARQVRHAIQTLPAKEASLLPKNLLSGLVELQSTALADAAEFDSIIPSIQRKLYQERKCETERWQAVLPNVFDGEVAANSALERLKDFPPDLAQAQQTQRQAYLLWATALQRLQEPSSGQAQTSPSEQQQQQAAVGKELSMDEVFRLMQLMQSEDRPPRQPLGEAPQGVARPW